MSERPGGPIGFFLRRPGLCLAMVGSVLTLSSVVSLAIVIFADKGSFIYLQRLAGQPRSHWIMLAGLFGFATGATMLIAANYLRGQPTKSRLFGSVLIGLGVPQIAVSLSVQSGGGLLLGILFVGIGVVLTRNTPSWAWKQWRRPARRTSGGAT